jgi:pyruvate kinase
MIATLAEAQGIAAVLVPANLPEARALAQYRPRVPFGFLVPDKEAARQVVLSWGAMPLVVDMSPATLPSRIKVIARSIWNFKKGSRIVLVAGNEKTGLQLLVITL